MRSRHALTAQRTRYCGPRLTCRTRGSWRFIWSARKGLTRSVSSPRDPGRRRRARGAAAPREPAERLGVTEPSVSRMTRVLGEAGLLEAVADPTGGNRRQL